MIYDLYLSARNEFSEWKHKLIDNIQTLGSETCKEYLDPRGKNCCEIINIVIPLKHSNTYEWLRRKALEFLFWNSTEIKLLGRDICKFLFEISSSLWPASETRHLMLNHRHLILNRRRSTNILSSDCNLPSKELCAISFNNLKIFPLQKEIIHPIFRLYLISFTCFSKLWCVDLATACWVPHVMNQDFTKYNSKISILG